MESMNLEKTQISEKEPIDIEDFDNAVELIRDAIEKGESPIITVPKEYADFARKGIKANATWIGEKIIAGTILREPYLDGREERMAFKIKATPDQILPRFTGPDNHFHGVIVFKGPIQPELIEEISL